MGGCASPVPQHFTEMVADLLHTSRFSHRTFRRGALGDPQPDAPVDLILDNSYPRVCDHRSCWHLSHTSLQASVESRQVTTTEDLLGDLWSLVASVRLWDLVAGRVFDVVSVEVAGPVALWSTQKALARIYLHFQALDSC